VRRSSYRGKPIWCKFKTEKGSGVPLHRWGLRGESQILIATVATIVLNITDLDFAVLVSVTQISGLDLLSCSMGLDQHNEKENFWS